MWQIYFETMASDKDKTRNVHVLLLLLVVPVEEAKLNNRSTINHDNAIRYMALVASA